MAAKLKINSHKQSNCTRRQCQGAIGLSVSGACDENLCITMLIPCTKRLGCGRQEVGPVSTSVPVVADHTLVQDGMLSCL